jgi:ParB-like chromosome segregation protein Spo0J
MIKKFENFHSNTIDINKIELEKEIVPVDTSNVNKIIELIKNGKMPLDKLRVDSMVSKLKKGGKLPPLILYPNNILKDGHHRFAAYQIAGVEDIPFEYYKKINKI